jgi:hypothetical protein
VDHSPGFSLLDFGVAGPHRPSNAYICSYVTAGPYSFLSENDVSVPGAISCRPIEVEEWILFTLHEAKELIRIFELATLLGE